MNTARHIEQDDLALFAMQLLSEAEAATILKHLQHCEECRRELAAVQGDLAVYAHTIDLHSPPAQARDRLLKQVGREKKIVPITRAASEMRAIPDLRAMEAEASLPAAQPLATQPIAAQPLAPQPFAAQPFTAQPLAAQTPAPQQPTAQPSASLSPETPFRTGTTLGIESSYLRAAYVEEEEPSHSFASRALPWAGWAIAAGMAVTAGNLYLQRNELQKTASGNATQLARLSADAASARQLLDTLNDPTALRVTLQKPQTAPVPQARTTYVADKGSLLLIASNMEPLQPYKVYELWLIPADGHDPIPAGTFHPDAKGNASVILPTLPKGIEAKMFGITIEDEGGSTTPTLPIVMAGA